MRQSLFDDGFHVGPLFIVTTRKPKVVRPSGGKEVWAKYKRATPPWADRNAIRKAWELSALATAMSGIQHSVDHIVPLVNPIVCGLHVEWNLRVIPLEDNVKKGNATWPDMPMQQLELL
jgi:hypothetical protein